MVEEWSDRIYDSLGWTILSIVVVLIVSPSTGIATGVIRDSDMMVICGKGVGVFGGIGVGVEIVVVSVPRSTVIRLVPISEA